MFRVDRDGAAMSLVAKKLELQTRLLRTLPRVS
jgi:hypothetical protein